MGTTAAILKALYRRQATVAQLAAKLGMHTSTVYVTLERRRLSGHVTREKRRTPGQKSAYVYMLTSYGHRNLGWWEKQ